ncbi:MAG TPA: hypothetical protein VIG25_25695 [Pyrinomonadaceae bacterium]|jgi:hypothetical protein
MTIPVEVFQISQLPVIVGTVELLKMGNGYSLRCFITSNSDEKLLGFRYTLLAIDSNNIKRVLANHSEAVALAPYASKRKTFAAALSSSPKDYDRIVLMLEQIVGSDSIWEVVKAKDALDAYVSGDFTVVPSVLRVPNHVDAPTPVRVIY